MAAGGLGRFKLLASAVAGRLVDVGPGEAGEPAWTDGVTIFVDAGEREREQLRCLLVQAALLGAGSLHADVVRSLARRPALARRYLAVEGHRALAVHDALLPAAARSLIDARVAARTESPAASLVIATSRDAIDDPPASFGTIRPRQIRAPVEAVYEDRHATACPVKTRSKLGASSTTARMTNAPT